MEWITQKILKFILKAQISYENENWIPKLDITDDTECLKSLTSVLEHSYYREHIEIISKLYMILLHTDLAI